MAAIHSERPWSRSLHGWLFALTMAALAATGCENPTGGGDGGTGSGSSDPTDTSPPAAVTQLAATGGDGTVLLAWTDPEAENLDHIEITWEPGGSEPQSVDPGVQAFSAANLTNGQQYAFAVVAVDGSGNRSAEAQVTATPSLDSDGGDDGSSDTTAPSEVTGVSAVPASGSVSLTWSDPPEADFDAVVITWSPNGSAPQMVSAGAENYTATGLTNGTQYSFTLKTVDASGNESAGALQVATPKASTNAALSTLTVDGSTVSGFDPAVFSYTVTLPNGTSSVSIGATTADPHASLSGDTGVQSVTTGANPLTIVVTAEDGVTTESYTVSVNIEASADTQLSDLTVDGSSLSGFTATTYYYSLVKPVGTSSVTVGATKADAGATVSGTGSQPVSPGRTELDIVVTAQDGQTTATYTVEVQVPPASPTNVAATEGTQNDRISLSWDSVGGAGSYRIYRWADGAISGTFIDSTTATSYDDLSAEAASGDPYDYEVSAVADTVVSARSAKNRGYAGADASISISFENPDDPTITLSGSSAVAAGAVLSVSADGGYDSYTWYLDGEAGAAALTQSGTGVDVGTGSLYIGVHTLSVVVTLGSNTYSAQFSFTVES